MDSLQKSFCGVFELPLLRHGQKTASKKTLKKKKNLPHLVDICQIRGALSSFLLRRPSCD
jgi:hypothetical protein